MLEMSVFFWGDDAKWTGTGAVIKLKENSVITWHKGKANSASYNIIRPAPTEHRPNSLRSMTHDALSNEKPSKNAIFDLKHDKQVPVPMMEVPPAVIAIHTSSWHLSTETKSLSLGNQTLVANLSETRSTQNTRPTNYTTSSAHIDETLGSLLKHSNDKKLPSYKTKRVSQEKNIAFVVVVKSEHLQGSIIIASHVLICKKVSVSAKHRNALWGHRGKIKYELWGNAPPFNLC